MVMEGYLEKGINRLNRFSLWGGALLSGTMYLLINLRETTPPETRQLNISISHSKQFVDDVVGQMTL